MHGNLTIREVKNNLFYKQLVFIIEGVNCRKQDKYKGYKKESVKYCFGNKKYHEDIDKVFISIYDDVVMLRYDRDGRSYQRNLRTNKEYTDESKILEALDCWKCAIYN